MKAGPGRQELQIGSMERPLEADQLRQVWQKAKHDPSFVQPLVQGEGAAEEMTKES